MAEGNGAVFNNAKELLLLKEIDLVDDELKMILVTGWTPTVDGEITYTTFAGVTEESGTGYTAGGATVASKTVTQDDANNVAYLDAVDVTWTGLSVGTPGYAVLYDNTHASKPAICYWEIGTTASNGSDYKLVFNASGIFRQA